MSDNERDFLKSLLEASSPQQTLALATLSNLESLPPATADAAYRCALVHWFNEDIIQALLVEGEPKHLGRPFDRTQPLDYSDLYRQLPSLPFVEEYSGRGFRFHDLTRDALLDYLWREENDFYRLVSKLAADYFDNEFSRQFTSETSDELVDWDLLVELAYHFLIVDEAQALEQLSDWMDALVARGLTGQCHALVQAAEEHAAAGRLDPQTAVVVRYWRSHVAYLTNDYPLVETIAQELMVGGEEDVPGWVQSSVTYYWADSLRLMGKYDGAQENFLKLFTLASDPESGSRSKIEALLGLGLVAESRGDFPEAETYYKQALETAVRDNVFISLDDDDDGLIITKGLLPDDLLPDGLQIYEPLSWQSQLLALSDEEEGPSGNGSEQAPESDYLLFYFIDIDDGELPASEEPDEGEGRVLIVVPDIILAQIWLRFGYLYQNRDEYDKASACARLAGQFYEDLDNFYGVQSALQLLYSLGAITGDLELMEMGADFQQELLALAREQNNRTAELEALLALAYARNIRDDYRSARENYTAAWNLAQELDDPSSKAVALDGLARLDWIEGDLATAETRFHQALDLHRQLGRREGEARLLNALAGFELGRFQAETARGHAQEALRIFHELQVPNGQVEALTVLGDIFRYEEKYDQALAMLEEVLALARDLEMPSETVTTLNSMGLIYSLDNQNDQAFEVYHQALALAKEIGQLSTQGNILMGLGDVQTARELYDEGREFYQQADEIFAQIDLRSGRLEALFGLLAIHQVRKEGEKAVQRAEEAVAMAEQLGDLSQIVRAKRSLASALLLLHDHEQALVVLDQALALRPFDPQTLSAKGELLLDAADYEGALSLFDQALERDESHAYLWQMRGWALENTDPPRAEQSRAAYQTAVDLKQDNFWALKGLANALRLAGEEEAARAKYQWLIDQLLAAEKVEKWDYSLLAWCYYSSGEYAEAVQWLRRSLDYEPEDLSVLFDLALCTVCLGDDAQAVSLYEQGVEKINERQPLGRRGPLHVARTDLLEAVTELPSLTRSPAIQEILQLLDAAITEAREP